MLTAHFQHKFFFIALLFSVITVSCSKNQGSAQTNTRSYRMGFAVSAPRPDFNLIIQSLNLWTPHADAAIISNEVPWDSLLDGQDVVAYTVRNTTALVNFYRQQNLKLWIYIDPQNGLNRQIDANPLVKRGKSIAQEDVQAVYRRYAFVMDSLFHPDHLGLALETNLIRIAAPSSIYQGVKNAVNNAAADIRKFDKTVPLSISVQAEAAWGKLGNGNTYTGIGQDFTDFPFVQEIGISSYAYLAYKTPSDIPPDYYSRLTAGKQIPVFVSEGGWTSANIPANSVISNPQTQQAYYIVQDKLLQNINATAWFQLAFTDLAVSAWPSDVQPGLIPFAFLGVVDTNFTSKPSFYTWDSLRSKPLSPGR